MTKVKKTMESRFEKEWEKDWKNLWKPLLKTKGKWDEKKIKNEMHDLVFIYEQIAEVYCHITGGLLSKPMYYANTIITHYEDELTKAIEEELKANDKAWRTKINIIRMKHGMFDDKMTEALSDLLQEGDK